MFRFGHPLTVCLFTSAFLSTGLGFPEIPQNAAIMGLLVITTPLALRDQLMLRTRKLAIRS